MPADTDIILAAGNIQGPSPNNLLSMFSLAQQVQQAKQETVKKNALLSAFSDPNSVDPATGTPTPQAIRKVMAVDPEMGLKLQDDALGAQVKRAQAAHYQTEAGKNNFDFMSSVAGIGYDAYNAARKAGKSEPDAIAAGQAARNEAAKNNGGVVGDDVADGILSKPFDPAGARALAGSNKEWSTRQNEEASQERQDKSEAEREKHDQAMERLGQQRVNVTVQAQGAPAGAGTDDAVDYAAQIYREKGQLPPRSAGPGFIKAVIAKAAEQAKASGGGAAGDVANQSVIKSDASSLGNITKIADSAEAYENTARENMKIVREKMPKGAVTVGPWLGKWVQDGKVGLGDKDVPPYATALITVANEYAKVMSGSTGAQGSTVDSRKEAAEMLNRAQTPDQVNAVLDVMERDMENKKKSYKGQREEIQGRIQNAGSPAKNDAAPKVTAVADEGAYNALPKGAWYSKPGDPAGTHRVKQ